MQTTHPPTRQHTAAPALCLATTHPKAPLPLDKRSPLEHRQRLQEKGIAPEAAKEKQKQDTPPEAAKESKRQDLAPEAAKEKQKQDTPPEAAKERQKGAFQEAQGGRTLHKIKWSQEEKEASYKEIQRLLHAATQEKDQEALAQLLDKIQPILQKSCRHFFGVASEDMIQEGYLCAIQLIRRYDPTRENVKFLGYLKKMIMFFYWDQKKKDLKEKERFFCADAAKLEQGIVETGFEAAELSDAVQRLEAKERRIVQEHIMRQKQLNLLCQEMDISYAYGKELKKKALDQLRSDCFTLRLPKKAKVKTSAP